MNKMFEKSNGGYLRHKEDAVSSALALGLSGVVCEKNDALLVVNNGENIEVKLATKEEVEGKGTEIISVGRKEFADSLTLSDKFRLYLNDYYSDNGSEDYVVPVQKEVIELSHMRELSVKEASFVLMKASEKNMNVEIVDENGTIITLDALLSDFDEDSDEVLYAYDNNVSFIDRSLLSISILENESGSSMYDKTLTNCYINGELTDIIELEDIDEDNDEDDLVDECNKMLGNDKVSTEIDTTIPDDYEDDNTDEDECDE